METTKTVNAPAEIDYRDSVMDQAVAIVRTYETASNNIEQARKEVKAAHQTLLQKQAVLDETVKVMKSARTRLDAALASPKPTV